MYNLGKLTLITFQTIDGLVEGAAKTPGVLRATFFYQGHECDLRFKCGGRDGFIDLINSMSCQWFGIA
jgi:hypothetical protein